ncbi:DUF397 domain-containing protein [Streptomyces aureoverticillatus]|uniref:DUF397 domain-containing protein n=1 Tax=Streptomyces aureoverticillatus TaxID=66871 RepID=UPI0013D96D7D|nr:DUF397 domain-containing protein [Streptomyces aureoverticillatus]QIB45528.1 DUF397 domain-containing protein [Streptomyces aureoverticillatus]
MIRKASTGDVSELKWFKSSYSDSSNPSDCVEVAVDLRSIHIRDSKNPAGPQLALPPTAWVDFIAYATE